ncbi:MAG: GTP 3',8-cyclase MoaA [Anaerolineae bacterium]|nr:GTP 3',8-cyclase MoaA [Anaerolineae bacterium]NIN93411.1 GTP 3',8-cyclase MoaA [Anaerolineae bacterium]NIQ76519.1 GTP 3',8-cyclase MoaA [Anaerolineae bacterium]
MTHLDAYNRPISYLRISVTDRCNLRCAYCMPPEGVQWVSHGEILGYEEIETVVRAAAELDISKVRLTGGEPLVRLGIVDLVRMLASVPGVDDLAMTTNGILLSRFASALAEAGLQRVNISLDSLRPDRFRSITRGGRLEEVLRGMEAARQAGLEPIKINTVVIRGMNDDEVVSLARQTMEEGWNLRFIEFMPVGIGTWIGDQWRAHVVTAKEIRDRIESALGRLEPVRVSRGSGPARYYRLAGAHGSLGFITAISDHFCYQCNRMRLTADGQLRPCLLSDEEIDLRPALRHRGDVTGIKELLLRGVQSKPRQHPLLDSPGPDKRTMSQIGG